MTERFRRVKAEEIEFVDERLKDNSFAARVSFFFFRWLFYRMHKTVGSVRTEPPHLGSECSRGFSVAGPELS